MNRHLVCHDCEAEGIVEDPGTAEELKEWHEEERGHSVSMEEVAKA